MARKVEIQIVGDDRSLKRALGSAEHGSSRLGGAFRTAAAAAAGFAAVLGAEKVVEFGKDAVTSAAQVQKSMENVRAQFGKASDDVIKFGEHAASSLGISEQASLGFSSQIGLVARNLGIGHDKAAQMDVGLQKLAGSIGMIKGEDPAGVFDKLSLALQGNTRGLKAMGITVTPLNEKLEAMRLGFIGPKGTISSLTGAQKASVIYGIATRHLGQFTAEARAHSGDFSNQILILKARLSNFADSVGANILPVVSGLVGELGKIANAPNLTVGIGIAVHGIAAAARDIASGIQHAFVGSSKTVKIKAPSGLVIGERQDFSKGIIQNIADGLRHADWSKIGHTVGSAIGGAIHFSAGAVDKLVVGLVSAINAHRGDIANAGLLVGVAMFTKLTDPTFWISNWQVTVPAIISGVMLALGPESKLALLLKDLPFIGPFFRALEGLGSLAIKAMGPLVRGIGRGLVDVFPILERDGEQIGVRLLGRLRSIPGRVGGIFESVGRFIGRELGNAVKVTAQEAARIGGRLIDILDGFIGRAGNVATRIVGRILDPFQSLAGRIAGPVLRAGRTVVNAVGGVIGRAGATAVKVGRAIMEGIASGLDSLVTWLEGKISGIASGLLSKAKGILHIGSPSRVFAEEIGKPIMEGVALGITKNAHLPHGALGDALAPTSFAGGATGGRGGGGRGEVIQLVLDGRVLAEVMRDRDKRYRRQNAGRQLLSGS